MDKQLSTSSQKTSITKKLTIVELKMLKTKVYFYKGKFSDFQNLMESEGYSTESLEDSGIDGLCFDFGGIQAI